MTHSVTWTLQDAKAQFSRVVAAAARGQAQRVTKHGRDAVVVISAAEFEAFRSGRTTSPANFIAHLLAMPKQDASKAKGSRTSDDQLGAAKRARIALRELDLT